MPLQGFKPFKGPQEGFKMPVPSEGILKAFQSRFKGHGLQKLFQNLF